MYPGNGGNGFLSIVIVSPTDAIPGFLIPVTIYPVSPADKKSHGVSSGEKVPTSSEVNFSFETEKSRFSFLEIFPSNTSTYTITPLWFEYLKSKISARQL